jgi:hypothetical protein
MNAAELLTDLGRLGIRLEADGERLLYYPRSALTPDLLARLKAHKADVLALLRPAPEASPALPVVTSDAPAKPVCRCGSTTWRDVPIHGGQSVRRDCGRCGRFLDFPVWYGKHTGHNGQHKV